MDAAGVAGDEFCAAILPERLGGGILLGCLEAVASLVSTWLSAWESAAGACVVSVGALTTTCAGTGAGTAATVGAGTGAAAGTGAGSGSAAAGAGAEAGAGAADDGAGACCVAMRSAACAAWPRL